MPKTSRRIRVQAAMEFLSTYAWAILVIAVVLAALFGLGLFNPLTYVPRAQPGGCSVYRPFGSYNIKLLSLEGQCSGLLPKYVAQFNGQSSYVDSGNSAGITKFNAITMTAWVKPSLLSGEQDIVAKENDYKMTILNGAGNLWFGTITAGGWGGDGLTSSGTIKAGAWYFIAVTYDGTTKKIFINAAQDAATKTTSGSLSDASNPLRLGCSSSSCFAFLNGQVADVQLYNSSLALGDIKALYTEGIGGAPLNLQSLVGWWPLNGDSADYSGNGNTGVQTNVVFSTTWTTGYSNS